MFVGSLEFSFMYTSVWGSYLIIVNITLMQRHPKYASTMVVAIEPITNLFTYQLNECKVNV